MRRPGQVLSPAPAARARLGLRLREPLERRRRLRALPAGEDRPPLRRGLARDGARRRLPASRTAAAEPLPIRVRLTLAFAVAMAVVLLGAGSLLYARLARDLDARSTAEPRSRRAGRRALVRRRADRCADARASRLAERGETLRAAPRRPGGSSSMRRGPEPPPAARRPRIRGGSREPLSSTGRGRRAATSRRGCSRGRSTGTGDAARRRRRQLAEDRATTLDRPAHRARYRRPVALLLASPAGYLLAGAALRPVEAMRRRAARDLGGRHRASGCPCRGATTSSRRLGKTLNEMLARLDAALEHERGFVADASHELRTPLAILRDRARVRAAPRAIARGAAGADRSAGEETDRLPRSPRTCC